MFLQLSHTKLQVYGVSSNLVTECHRLTNNFPSTEKFAFVQQTRRAALSVHLNLAEGCGRKSEIERKRFFEISRGLLIELDTAFDIAVKLNYCSNEDLSKFGVYLVDTFRMLSGMISKNH
jgi:four helix bundle protein